MHDGQGGTFYDALKTLRDTEVDYAGFSEHNTDTTQRSVTTQYHKAAQAIYQSGHYKIELGTSPIPAINTYKPGGTMSIITDNFSSRKKSGGSDPWGRWSYFKLHGRQGTIITMITAYQPCEGRPKVDGSLRVIDQQYSLLIKAKRTRPHNIRKHFVQDLQKFIQSCQADQEQIILGGDFNDLIGQDGSGMTRLVRECQLTDIIHHYHGTPPHNFATWLDGKRVVDYIFVDSNTADCVTACGYEPFNYRIPGDHRAMYVDFDTLRLYGSNHTPLAPMPRRDVLSKKPHHISQYFPAKYAYLERHNFFTRLTQLQQHPNHQLAERLDKDLVTASIHAGKQCTAHPRVPFSPKLVRLRTRYSLLCLLHIQLKNNINMDDGINKKLRLLDETFVIPTTLQDCKSRMKEALRALQHAERHEKKTGQRRQEHLTKLAEAHALHGDQKAAKILK
jgi:hypothetical protein